LDVHLTHTNSNEDPQLAFDSGVVIILLPGHAMYRLQPLDVELLRPLSSLHTENTEKLLQVGWAKWQCFSVIHTENEVPWPQQLVPHGLQADGQLTEKHFKATISVA
jgi:hypothetical protein